MDHAIPNKRLLSMADISTMTGISKASLSRAINGKLANCERLPHIKLGRRALVRPDTLESWLRDSEK